MSITLTYTELGRTTAAILRLAGVLDRSNYDELIAQAWAARDAGADHLIVDLREILRVGTAGMVGLHAVALIAQGMPPPNPAAGWAALHALAEGCCPMQPLAVVSPRSLIRQALARAPLTGFLAIHADLDTALAALAA